MIYAAMAAVMKDTVPVGKEGENREQRYSFRAIEDVMVAVRASLIQHGVFYMPTVLTRVPESRTTKAGQPMNVVHLEIRYDFYAADGSSVSSVVWGEGADTADKATNKAMSAALKYNLVQALSIAAKDILEDSDRSAQEAGPQGGYRSAGEAFASARPAPPRNGNGNRRQPQRPPVQVAPLADDDPWKDRIADIADRDEAERLYKEVAGLHRDGQIDEARARLLGAHITAKVTNDLAGQQAQQQGNAPAGENPWAGDPVQDGREDPWSEPPPDQQHRIRPEDQGAPRPAEPEAGDDEDWLNDFAAKLEAAESADDLTALQRSIGPAIKFKHVTPGTSAKLTAAIRDRRNALNGASA